MKKSDNFADKHRVREYTAAEMYDLLSGVGFSVESISYHGVINPKNVKSRLINLFQQVFKKLKLNLQVIGSI